MTKPLRTMILHALRYPAFMTSEDLLRTLVGVPDCERVDHVPRPRSVMLTNIDQKRAMRFASLLAELVKEGRVARVLDETIGEHRYRLVPRYRLRRVLDSWHVDRLHPDIADHWHTIVMGTEGEARACLAALEVMS